MVENLCTNGILNCDDILGKVILSISTQTTGDIFITFLFILLIILAVALMFGIRLEYTMIIILPLLLGLMIASSQFIGIGAVVLIYLAIILTGNFILK